MKVVQQWWQQVVKETFVVNEQLMDEQEKWLIVENIYDSIKTKLWIYLGFKSWELVMGKTLSCAIVFMALFDHILHAKVSIVQ